MDEPNRPPGFDGWLKAAVCAVSGHYGVDVREAEAMVLACYQLFLQDPYWRALKCPMRAFIKPEQWRKYLPVAAISDALKTAALLQEVWNSITEPEPGAPRVLQRWVALTGEEAQIAVQALERHPVEFWRHALQCAVRLPRFCGENKAGWRLSPKWWMDSGHAEQVLADARATSPTATCTLPRCHRGAQAGWKNHQGLVQQGALCLLHAAGFEKWREEEQVPEPTSVEELEALMERWRFRGASTAANQSAGG
jgi:hypothetical protein